MDTPSTSERATEKRAGATAVLSPHKTARRLSGAAATDSVRSAQHPVQPPVARAPRICVVEDSYSALRLLFRALKPRGCEIDHVSTANDAVAAISAARYDVVLVGTPARGSALPQIELLRALRAALSLRSAIVLLALVDDSDATRRDALLAAGAADVLSVSETERLAARVFGALDGRDVSTPRTAATRATQPNESSTLKIFLLEDSYTLSLMLCDWLSKAKQQIEHFTTIDELLAAARPGRCDVLIADVPDHLTIADFRSFVREIRRQVGADDDHPLPIIALMQSADTGRAQYLLAAGAQKVIALSTAGDIRRVLSDALAATTNVTVVAEGDTTAPDRTANAVQAESVVSPPKESRRVVPHNAAPSLRRRMWAIAVLVAIGVAAAALTAAAGWWYWDVPSVEVAVARQGVVTHSVNANARVAPQHEVVVSAPTNDQVARVNVAVGDRVTAGAVLAVMDDRVAGSDVTQKNAELERVRAEVAELERMVSNGATGGPRRDIAAAVLREWTDKLARARDHLRRAEQATATARQRLDQTPIVAPVAGIVAQVNVAVGKWVVQGASLFTLADSGSREAAASLFFDEAKNVAVGMPVLLSVGRDSAQWQEVVTRLGAEEGAGEDKRARRTVYISLDHAASPPRIGTPLFAQFMMSSSSRAVKVPYESVFVHDGQAHVAVLQAGHVVYRPVRLGLRGLTEVEVQHGLVSGDYVILPRQELLDGQRVSTSTVVQTVTPDEDRFPLRQEFADIVVWSTEQLRQHYDESVVVDVRSKFEYDVAHIAKAVNVSVTTENFLVALEALRSRSASTPLVLYCNGYLCRKGYEAARLAQSAGFRAVFVYDAGMLEWLRGNQDRTTLLGANPAPLERLVSDDYFQGRLLDYDAFLKKALAGDALTIDIREAARRDSSPPWPATNVPLDDFIARLDRGEFRGRQLLIYDAVGLQVMWLQYVLEDRGHKNYFFLRGGMAGARGAA